MYFFKYILDVNNLKSFKAVYCSDVDLIFKSSIAASNSFIIIEQKKKITLCFVTAKFSQKNRGTQTKTHSA